MNPVRIVGGEARGRRLFAPEGMDTRPTADRVRESIFNILGPDIIGQRVLDLFAGSGAMGLEAVSRGASSLVLVDSSPKACHAIRRNMEIVKTQDRARLIAADYKKALSMLTGGFDLVFLDPPYRLTELYLEAANALHNGELLNDGAILVMEHFAKQPLAVPDAYEIFDERRYGDCAIAFVQKRAP